LRSAMRGPRKAHRIPAPGASGGTSAAAATGGADGNAAAGIAVREQPETLGRKPWLVQNPAVGLCRFQSGSTGSAVPLRQDGLSVALEECDTGEHHAIE